MWRHTKKGFTLLEVLIALIILTVGVIAITRAFSTGLFASTGVEDTDLALNIAQAKMEEIRNTSFGSIADNGPTPADANPDSPLYKFNVTVDETTVSTDLKRVEVTVDWATKGGTADVELKTLAANY